jgi:hypothetical protein
MVGIGRPTFSQTIILITLDAGVWPTGVTIFYAQVTWHQPGRRILDAPDGKTQPTYLPTDNNIIHPRWWGRMDVIIFYAQVTWYQLALSIISHTLEHRA